MSIQVGEVSTIPQWEKCERPEAVKLLEESAELFAAIQNYTITSQTDTKCEDETATKMCESLREMLIADHKKAIIGEACDVITTVCNILAGLGINDITNEMLQCSFKNRERGYYSAAGGEHGL